MKIAEVGHQVTDVEDAVRFYQRFSNFRWSRDGSGAGVVVGSSVLKLSPGSPSGGEHHLAFDIPAAVFADAKSWLADRVPLLRDSEGSEEIEGPPGWDSRSLYFSGPDRTILELIARRRLRHATLPGVFSGSHLVNISEVGLAVDSVPAAARRLGKHFDAASFGPRFDGFDPVGDESGLFILVTPGRAWLPDRRQHGAKLPLRVHLDIADTVPRSVRLSEVCTVTSGRRFNDD